MIFDACKATHKPQFTRRCKQGHPTRDETDLSPTVDSISLGEEICLTPTVLELEGLGEEIYLTPTVLELEGGFRKKSPRNGNADFSVFRRIYSRGVHEDANKDELQELWEKYVIKKEKQTMGPIELKKMLFAYVTFCSDFCSQQITWHKSGDKRDLYRRPEEQTISLGASQSIVECNRIKTILQDSEQSIAFLKKITDNDCLQLSRSDFFGDTNTYFHRVKAKLGMNIWANSLDAEFDSIDLNVTPDMSWLDSLQRDIKKENNGISEGTFRVRIIGAIGLKSHNGEECNAYAIPTLKNSSVPTVFREATNEPEWSQAFKFVRFTFCKPNPKDPVRKEFGYIHIMNLNWDKTTKIILSISEKEHQRTEAIDIKNLQARIVQLEEKNDKLEEKYNKLEEKMKKLGRRVDELDEKPSVQAENVFGDGGLQQVVVHIWSHEGDLEKVEEILKRASQHAKLEFKPQSMAEHDDLQSFDFAAWIKNCVSENANTKRNPVDSKERFGMDKETYESLEFLPEKPL